MKRRPTTQEIRVCGQGESPAIVAVVPTHNREGRLERLVEAFARQRRAPCFEVVIVDDASTDRTQETLRAVGENPGFPLRVLRLEQNSGPAAARNLGWRASSAPMVAFTDDDCVPSPDWLASMAAALESADLVQGATMPDPSRSELTGYPRHTMRVLGENGLYETCNMGYRRRTLEDVGGFDEGFRQPYGEDADLAWRAKSGGASSAFCSAAVVHHDVEDLDLRQRLRHARRLEGAVQLVAAHPGLRSRLHRSVWFRPSHEAAVLALAGLIYSVTTVRGPRARAAAVALSIGTYGWVRVRQEADSSVRRRVLTRLPFTFAEDLLQVGVAGIGSIRHRTLLL